MVRIIAHEDWLKTLKCKVVYHHHISNGWWLAEIQLDDAMKLGVIGGT